MLARWLLAVVVGIALAAAASLYAGWLRVPDRWNPFVALVIDEEPGSLTRYKLARLDDDPALCRSVLAASQLRLESVPDRVGGPGCELRDAVRIDALSAAVAQPFVLTCRTAAALALWDRHVLQAQARAHFGRPVTRIEHYGSYACRNVYGRENGPRSRHATADAVDIAGFTIAGGRRVRVLADWNGHDAEAAFLRDVHRGACRFFDAVLGPDYNAAHRDHLHFDRGSYRSCR